MIPKLNIKNTPHPTDRIVQLCNLNLSQEEVYNQVAIDCRFSIQTKKQKQNLADTIAQIWSMNVFAKGIIPMEDKS